MNDDNSRCGTALSCDAGICEAKDITYLARLYLYLGAPAEAAPLVEAALSDGRPAEGADSWMLLAQSWQQARDMDKAARAYIEAAKRTKASGDADIRLGQIYIQQEKRQAAAAALTGALKKGRLSTPGPAQLMLGVAQYYLGHHKQAVAAVETASRYPNVEKEAKRWLRQLRTAMAGSG
jgi:tetratricopeptide (TPR) repeat protein